jgi:CRISPR/Cas system-associated endonuclease Cas1
MLHLTFHLTSLKQLYYYYKYFYYHCIIIQILTICIKQQKVDPYWPEEIGDSLKYGSFTITTEALHTMADYTVRIMTVKKRVRYIFCCYYSFMIHYLLHQYILLHKLHFQRLSIVILIMFNIHFK